MAVLQSKRLVDVVNRVYNNVEFYRKKMQDLGVEPGDIKGIEDINKLPFTTKEDLRDHYPFGLLAIPKKDVVRVQGTSGTTGKLTLASYSQKDIDVWGECVARCLTMAGLTDEDVLHICYGYGLFTGGLGLDFGAKALGARVIGVRRTGTDKPDFVDELIHTDKLDEYLPQADCVAITLPGTTATKGMFDAERMAKMKDGAILLNVGRGMIVDTDALCAALENGKLAGAGVDVTDPEPLPTDHPLWKMENAVITPHISGGYHLQETHDRIVRIMAENLKRFLAGEPLRNVIDFSTGYRKL